MRTKLFTSINGWFKLALPVDWEEYDDGEEGTHAFFNVNKWTGNFRITALKNSNPQSDMATSLLRSELAENIGATQSKIGNYQTVSYKKETVPEGEEMVIYYWVLGKNNTALICSFTIDTQMDVSKKEKELQLIEKIIESIEII